MSADAQELLLNGYVEMTNEQYHSSAGISKSMLDAVAESPLTYWDAYINPEREPREIKHCFAVGDGTHKLVLEPGTFEHTYAVGFDKNDFPGALDTSAELKDECKRRGLMLSGTKPELAARLIEDGFSAECIMLMLERTHNATMAGRIPIPGRDYKNMMQMLRAVNADPWAAELLSGAATEQSYFVTDKQGILRKCRLDLLSASGQVVGDLKTTDDVSERGFRRTIEQRRYGVQAAWYLDIMHMLFGADAPQVFAFIAVQKTRPFDVGVHYVTRDSDVAARGRALYQRDLATLAAAYETGRWLGATRGEIIEVQLSSWEAQQELVYP